MIPVVQMPQPPLFGEDRFVHFRYAGYPAAARLIEELVREEGFERDHLERIFARIKRQRWILDFANRPKAKRSTGPTGAWARYRAKFITSDNISRGIGFWRRYGKALRRAQARYGVPPEYVVAIIGVETRYGGYLGKHRVIDALATLAFDYPRRFRFFTSELASLSDHGPRRGPGSLRAQEGLLRRCHRALG